MLEKHGARLTGDREGRANTTNELHFSPVTKNSDQAIRRGSFTSYV